MRSQANLMMMMLLLVLALLQAPNRQSNRRAAEEGASLEVMSLNANCWKTAQEVLEWLEAMRHDDNSKMPGVVSAQRLAS